MQNNQLHKFCWLWVPVLVIGIQLFCETALSNSVLNAMHTEGGSHEVAQFLVLVAAFLVAFITLFQAKGLWLKAWLVLAALCCFYVAGEEMSWGQHILNWSTPDYWAHINDQQETNLHNTSSWLDQKPRLLLEIGVLVGGLIIPLLQKYRPSLLPARFAIIYPSKILAVTALFTLGIKIADKFELFNRGSEVLELYLFYFVLLYLVILRQRLLQH